MPQNKRKDIVQDAKNISMLNKSAGSLNSSTGYKETGNESQVNAKARVLRQNDNGSHT